MFRPTLALLSSTLLLAACGQSGDLYLPDAGKKETVVVGAPQAQPQPAALQPPAQSVPVNPAQVPNLMDFEDMDFDDDDE